MESSREQAGAKVETNVIKDERSEESEKKREKDKERLMHEGSSAVGIKIRKWEFGK